MPYFAHAAPSAPLESPHGERADRRRTERERLARLLERAREGHGATVLISGDAGVGKTRLTAVLAGRRRARAARRRGPGPHPPYGPLVEALRDHLHAHPAGLADAARCAATSRCCCPSSASRRARPTAPRCSRRCARLAAIARRTTLVVLDDLQWSDEATLEVLAAIDERSPTADRRRLPLRRPPAPSIRSAACATTCGARAGSRRSGCARSSCPETTELLRRTLGREPAPSLARAIHDRTEGLPFFVEELASALRVSGAIARRRRGLELAGDGDVPLPDTVRDAVLIGTSELCRRREAAEVAAVAGERFDLAVVAALVERRRRHRADRARPRARAGTGTGAFRHALTREALYADLPWTCRRTLHRALAEALERRARPAATSRRTGSARTRASGRARRCCARRPTRAPCTPTATPRAPTARRSSCGRRGDEDAAAPRRSRTTPVLPARRRADRRRARLARADAAAAPTAAWSPPPSAAAPRCWSSTATATRRPGAPGRRRRVRGHGPPAEAAVERIAIANQRRLSARHREAVEIAQAAKADADRAGRIDLRIRALGIEGMARAKLDDHRAGPGDRPPRPRPRARARPHRGRRRALPAPQRHAVRVGGLPPREEALDTALALCQTSPDPDLGACVSCMAYVLRERGEWPRATRCAAR